MAKKTFLLTSFLLLGACNFFGPESKLKDLVNDNYKVIKKIAEGGESFVFLVEDKEGQKFAAKYWPKDKMHHHLRGTTPFDNAIKVHTKLKDNSYINQLHEEIASQVMILDYLEGPQLVHYLAQSAEETHIKKITQNLLDAFQDIAHQSIVPFKASAEHILIVGKEPTPKLIDTSSYIIVDNAIKQNREFEPQEFNLFRVSEMKKNLENKENNEGDDYTLIDGEKYAIIPPLTLYTIITERMDVFSRLLTKLAYLNMNHGTDAPKIESRTTNNNFGDDPRYIARPWTEEIDERAKNILHMAKYTGESPSYTAENFREDVGETLTISNMIYDKTRLCLENIEGCLKKTQ